MKKLPIYAGLMAFSAMSASAIYAAPDGRADQDGDRVVTKAEAMAAADAVFTKMDANGDGTLSDGRNSNVRGLRFAECFGCQWNRAASFHPTGVNRSPNRD